MTPASEPFLVDQRDEGPLLLGNAPAIVHLRSEIRHAGRAEATVLITGETGVGKEVVAALLHQASPRRPHALITVNCAALPDGLIESELFGHERGSFTDAYQDKVGMATMADRGTLFLDEIGEMSPRMQAVVLRFVETREIHRIGSTRRQPPVNTRIIAATNRHLPDRIASGDFRQDLYYRLNVIQLTIPPLRERGSDIVVLFMHYLEHFARLHRTTVPTLTPATHDLLLAYTWPGNVRELKNIVERMVIRRPDTIDVDGLPDEFRRGETRMFATASPGRASDAWEDTQASVAEAAWNEMVVGGKSFWVAVHPLFIDRELTKTNLRQIVRRGLELTHGSYRKLTDLFNIAPEDYKRFLAFLYQHECHLAFHSFRAPRSMAACRPPRVRAPRDR